MIIGLIIMGALLAIAIAAITVIVTRKNNAASPSGDIDKELRAIRESMLLMDHKNKESNEKALRNLESITRVMTDKKSRGRYGEVQLEQILNDAYGVQNEIVKKQQLLPGGGNVDIALDIDGQGLLPIDAKFPMEYFLEISKAENASAKDMATKEFVNQMKKHLDKVEGYIHEGVTTPFALIFIPSESVFAEIQSSQGLLDYSAKKRVYFTSPTSLLATVVVASNIKAQNDRVKNLPKIIKGLSTLNKHISTYRTSWEDINKKIKQINASAETHSRAVDNFENKADSILNTNDAKALLEDDKE